MSKRFPILLLPVAALMFALLTGCGAGGPEKQVEAYLKARAEGNANQMVSLSCSSWEGQARIEASTFKSLNARIEGLMCSAGDTQGNASTVTCAGKIITSYNGESREVNLADKRYALTLDGGEWRVCGYR